MPKTIDNDLQGSQRVAREITAKTERETCSLVLGHLQRGGSPLTADRVLAQRLGCSGTCFLAETRESGMVAVRGGEMRRVPFAELVGQPRLVDAGSDLIRTGRELNLGFGDEPAGTFVAQVVA